VCIGEKEFPLLFLRKLVYVQYVCVFVYVCVCVKEEAGGCSSTHRERERERAGERERGLAGIEKEGERELLTNSKEIMR
jgi:hypothetical protein